MRRSTALFLAITATSLLGLMAGFFFAFAVDVAPAMTHLDASGYITTQQWINRVVRNAPFGLAYFGAALLPFAAAAAAFWSGQRRSAGAWLLIALAYFATVFWLTRAVNLPINNELATWQASTPPPGWQQARDRWNEANLWRSIGSGVCFVAAASLLALSRPAARAAG